ncbi:mus7 mms22 family protein [Colletotrichum truncatum]|uniref:Mus7 mms22 family protein n=1 Tax=Colletotrichum truncatum TaxID=5467 RepID=A0ACC3Z967_COLTU|nr:mus7 mms22 family protein [Colletotrichum truncatum]KAF6793542.1 mus7 mms22 family protein [Colletotrichum truncatum]
MANWKVLGEVPDSDDELDFDSQEFEGLPNIEVPPNKPNGALQATRALKESVWDVPESSQTTTNTPANSQAPVSNREPTILSADEPASSPLSSALDVDDLADIFDWRDQAAGGPSMTRQRYTIDGRDDSPDPLMGDDSISTSYVKITAPLPEFPFENDEQSLPPPIVPLASPERRLQNSPRNLQSPLRDQGSSRSQHRSQASQHRASMNRDEEVARETALRYERSLRPRKPIQEHPYLIENAQYSKVFKSHGLRPMRMATESVSRRQRIDDDSQEKDFEASQESTVDGLNETTDESQYTGPENPSNSRLLQVSPSPSSSLLRTSSPKHKGGPSSQPSQGGETDNTSLSDNEDLPSIEEIFRKSTTTQARKRRRLVGDSVAKRRHVNKAVPDICSPSGPTFQTYDEVYDIHSSPSVSPQIQTTTADHRADPVTEMSDIAHVIFDEDIDEDDPFRLPERLVPAAENQRNIDMTMSDISDVEDGIQLEVDDTAAISGPESEAGSESGSEVFRDVGRRIRGVLPASWLRLDQQTTRPKSTQPHHHEPSPKKTPRRGVAVRRIGRSTTTTTASFIFEDSDDEGTSASKPVRNAISNNSMPSLQRDGAQVIEVDDDDSSAMEDNGIDHMAPSRKRQMALSEAFRPAKKQRKDAMLPNSGSKRPGRPPKATGRCKKNSRLDPWVKRCKSQSGGSRLAAGAKSPPRLSILDVIEPNAPRFLKIAARTAQTRSQLGRASPMHKTIRLATRKDNIDAGSVLQRWKGNKIQPRQGLQRSRRARSISRHPLAQVSSNIFSRTSVSSPKSQTAKQSARAIREETEAVTPSPGARRTPRPFSRQQSSGSQHTHDAANRPAQLETDLADQPGRMGFHARKRALDALFRWSKSQSLSTRSVHLESVIDDECSAVSEQSLAAKAPPEPSVVEKPRLKRPRKPAQPVRVDVASARFRHADDPLPTTEVSALAEAPKTALTDNQLLGLGPFGTQYTQHFEIFPLDCGVFFHETTLIGSGRVETAVDDCFIEKVWQPRPRVSFHLGDQILRWDRWSEQVSSEFGILTDSILDQILKPVLPTEVGFDTNHAARFILDYVQKSMSFLDDAGAHSFVTRLVDVAISFLSRLNLETLDSGKRLKLIDVLSNLILVMSCTVRLCQKHSTLVSDSFTVENVLRKVAETLVRVLLETGLDEVVHLYDDLQTLTFRERGIRPDKVIPHAWVLLMRVLESLRIPRMSFWDVTYSHMIQPAVLKAADAVGFERLWQEMFILLPLCEFDNSGVLIANRRHRVSMDGWNLPQQILKRVFQLYRDNPRQSPSFNDYCRMLVSRCHYLVDQWGWQKSGGIIGTIFDFFGSHDLAHLRNEEAFRSARFLDNLHHNPSLKVDLDDRCFHIFLKLVALAIKKLREKGLINDIRNLVARTLPNHDRQYSKEQNVHQHDLAALRNHHDLLCTLFWAAPPDIRPGIHNLEKLVIPASSHKEACLINLRAWSQLARFVAHEESAASFLPLSNWQSNIFKQLLDQYNSAASDIKQQFLAMPKDNTSGINEDFMNSIVAINKAATMEIILFSVKSSMDVVQHASSLELARLASNTVQLQHVFQHFSTLPADFPSALLQASLTILERLLGRIESVFNEADESQDSMASNTVESEDAILMLERDLAAVFFSMARCILSNQAARGKPNIKAVSSACVEQCVVVAGIMTSLFVRCQMMRLSQVFKRGKYCLFENMPNRLSMSQRPYLPLFLSTVAERGAAINLTDIGVDVLQLWLLTIVQPNHCLRFENQFGQQLQREGHAFIPEKAVGLVVNPGYLSNRDFFEYAMIWMRQSLQTTDAAMKKLNLSDFTKTLDNVMHQMRADLQATAIESTEHPNYVRFVRGIISLITTYGADICKVLSFFKEVSKEYSPPAEDPELQVARILSYGLKLAEGNTGIASSLFYLLLNNFKKALQLGRLPHEVTLLKAAMKSDAVVAFTVRMLSAVLHATRSSPEAYALLDVFCDALGLVWNGSAINRQLSDDTLTSVTGLITSILDWATAVRGTFLCAEHIHILRKIVWLVNTLQPTIESFSLAFEERRWWHNLMERLEWFSLLVEGAQDYLRTELGRSQVPSLSPLALFRRLRDTNAIKIQDAMVLEWSRVIAEDVQRNWVVKGPIWTVPGSTCDTTSTQPAHGTIKLNWNMQELVTSLHDQLQIWNQWWIEGNSKPGERKVFTFEDYAIF